MYQKLVKEIKETWTYGHNHIIELVNEYLTEIVSCEKNTPHKIEILPYENKYITIERNDDYSFDITMPNKKTFNISISEQTQLIKDIAQEIGKRITNIINTRIDREIKEAENDEWLYQLDSLYDALENYAPDEYKVNVFTDYLNHTTDKTIIHEFIYSGEMETQIDNAYFTGFEWDFIERHTDYINDYIDDYAEYNEDYLLINVYFYMQIYYEDIRSDD